MIGVRRGEMEEQGLANLFEEIMTGNFPNLVKEVVIQVQEAQRVSNNMNTMRSTPKHNINKMPSIVILHFI